MADSKITALTALTAADPVNDMFPVVDVSDTTMAASGTTKKISVNNILGASGTATLASATITGAATVGTTLGVTGVSTFAAGTALLPALTTTGDVNTGIYYPAADTFAVTTGGTERYRVDSAGQFGVGITPNTWSAGYRFLMLPNGGSLFNDTSNGIYLGANYYALAGSKKIASGYALNYLLDAANGAYKWFTSTAGAGTAGDSVSLTQAMTLDASGNLLVKKTALGTTDVGFQVESNGSVASTLSASTSATNTFICYSTGAAAYRFYVGLNGTINATNTTISAISDARFKENVQDIDVGLGAILALKPRKFDWKAGKGKDIKGDRGFIAQEFEQVFPQLVDEWADPAPEGEAPYKSVRQDLIPVLVKAIQELTARVQTLEAR
jgi:hypothetical protein